MDSQDRLYEIAKNVNWFEDPETVLKNTDKFLSYTMKYGSLDNVNYLIKFYGKGSFVKALGSVYNRVLDDRSRAYFTLIVS